jgi:Tol biopolymer transport system component
VPPEFDGEGTEPEIAPDGRRAVAIRDTGGNIDIWLVDLVRGISSRLTSDEGTELWPGWFPDGGAIFFGKLTAFRQSLSGERRPILEHLKMSRVYPSQWSPDGKYLLFRAEGAQTGSDLLVAVDDGKSDPIPVAAGPFAETRGQFSPDGRWVSYESNESGQNEIYVRPFNRPGTPARVSLNGGSEARWHPNGREVFFIGPGSRMMLAAVRPAAAGDMMDVEPARELFTTTIFRGGTQGDNAKFQYAVAPDGQRLLINEALASAGSSPLIVTLNWRPPDGPAR